MVNDVSNSHFLFLWLLRPRFLWAPFWGHMLTQFCAKVVIGAIAGVQGAPEYLKAGSSYARLFQETPREFRLGGGGTPQGSANGCPTVPSALPPPVETPPVETEKE